jgi:hypothetical protein
VSSTHRLTNKSIRCQHSVLFGSMVGWSVGNVEVVWKHHRSVLSASGTRLEALVFIVTPSK